VKHATAIIRRHRAYSVYKMLAIATDGVAWSVCVSVGHVHDNEPCKQKRLNRSRCRLGSWLLWAWGCIWCRSRFIGIIVL